MQKQINYNHSLVSYNLMGKGKPVLLVHGFGEDAKIWINLITALEKDFLVISIDLPGTGNSDWIPDTTIETCAQIIANILDQEQINQCTLIGHSMGGYIALAFAKKHFHKLNGIGLLHSTAYADTEEKKAARRKSIQFIDEHGAALYLRQTIPNLFAQNFVANSNIVVEQQINSNAYMTNATVIGYTNAMINREDSITFLQTTDLPVLYIIGRKDNAVPYENSMAQCYIPKISYIHILNEVAHMGMLEQPMEFNGYILDYLKEIN